jgi:hypothetical protein
VLLISLPASKQASKQAIVESHTTLVKTNYKSKVSQEKKNRKEKRKKAKAKARAKIKIKTKTKAAYS